MIPRSISALIAATLFLALAGCTNPDLEDAEKPAATTAPIDNNAPEAKNAPGAEAPDSGLPPPGGPRLKPKKK